MIVVYSLVLLFIFKTTWGEVVSPQEADIQPLSKTIILNRQPGILYGGRVENQEMACLKDGIWVYAWEDNDADVGGGWVLLDTNGNLHSSSIRSFQTTEGKLTWHSGHYAPKVRASKDGSRFLYAGTYYDWSGTLNPKNKIYEYAGKIEEDDAPLIQVVRADGEYAGPCFTGLPSELTNRTGDIRLADARFLSDGNILLVAHDMQLNAGGYYGLPESADEAVIASVCRPDGRLLYGPVAVQQSGGKGLIWNGVGVGTGQFGIRFAAGGEAHVRFFQNDLQPLTDQMALPEPFNHGYRGDECGWDANRQNRYLHVIHHDGQILAMVLNGDGSKKFSLPVFEKDVYTYGYMRCNGALDEQGNFIVTAEYRPDPPWRPGSRCVIVARFFNADGTPKTNPFYVTEVPPEDWVARDHYSTVEWEKGVVAISWLDMNTNLGETAELAVRFFQSPFEK